MIDLLAIGFVAPALAGAAALSKAGALLSGLTKAGLTGYTAYEGAKMIPYFTNQDSVLEDLTEKPERKITGKRDLNFLDEIRLKTSGLENQYGKFMVPKEDGGEGLTREEAIESMLDETKDAYERRTEAKALEKKIRGAEGEKKVEAAKLTDNDRRLQQLNRKIAEGTLDGQRADNVFRSDQLGLQREQVLSNKESRLAEIQAILQGNKGSQAISLAELGLREQAQEIARQERRQDKMAERRQAIFMALMALTS